MTDNGTPIALDQWVTVSSLSGLDFIGSATPGTDDIWLRAYNGSWSPVAQATITDEGIQTKELQYYGFDYVAFFNGTYEDSNSLPTLVQTHANSIEATLDYGIDAQTSQVVADSNYTDSLTALGNTIAQAESLGLSVMVRPLIDFLNPAESAPYSVGEWRQDYQPTNVAAFFASYQQMIVQEAEVAQANGAQMLSIGAELDQLTGAQYLPYWTDIINAVHAVFSGALTYSASWNTANEVSFWSQLNYEGIDCYVPLSNAQNPTLQQLVNGWLDPATPSSNPGAYAVIGNQSPIQYFENLSAQSGKPLIFTELGYANDSGAAADPAASGNSPDPTLQSELYQAFFQAWGQTSGSALNGVYFWEWDPNGSTSNVGPNIDSFSPQNSPAQAAATAGFEAVSTANSAGAAALDGSVTIGTSATVELAADNSQSVTFNGATGMLKLDQSSTFSGEIFNFTGNGNLATSDQIDLKDILFGPGTTASYSGNVSGGTLTVSDAQHDTTNIALAGNYTDSTLSLFSDGNGGTLVVDPPIAQNSAGAGAAAANAQPNGTNGAAIWSTWVTGGEPGRDSFVFKPGFDNSVVANAAVAIGNELLPHLHEQIQPLWQAANAGHDIVFDPGHHDGVMLPNLHAADPHAGSFITH